MSGKTIPGLALLSCLVLVSCSPAATDDSVGTLPVFDLAFDESLADVDQAAVLGVTDGGLAATYQATVDLDTSKGEADSIDIWLLDNDVKVDVALLGMPADNRWRMLKVKDVEEWVSIQLMAYLWEAMERWSPRIRLVHARFNGQDAGAWILSETVSRGDERIPLKKLEPEEQSYNKLTGGYLLAMELMTSDSAADEGFVAASGLWGRIRYPETPSLLQQNWIAAWWNGFELAAAAASQHQFDGGQAAYADRDSWIDWIIATEMSGLSPLDKGALVVAKNRSEPLVPCPHDDYRSTSRTSDAGLVTADVPLVADLLVQPAFLSQLSGRWAGLRAGSLSDSMIRSVLRSEGAAWLTLFPDDGGPLHLGHTESSLMERIWFLDTVLVR